MSACASDDELVKYVQRELPDDQHARLTEHFAGCDICRPLLAATTRAFFPVDHGLAHTDPLFLSPADRTAERPTLAMGTRVGRYVIQSKLGMGGAAVVYSAEDPELGRSVAIKLLRQPGWSREQLEVMRARTLREGQAMARLRHPNAVAVHDVGMHEGQLFIAMELVDGRTLREWLREQPRPWRECVAVLRKAGEGLQAAHEAGIIHRDFKPDNVLVGHDGRVCVSDFGLAATGAEPALPAGALPSGELSMQLTRTGAVIGTPRYMAPEQFQGGTVDERTDVFSFFVTLHEALYGERPFAGDSFAEVSAAVTAGELREPARRAGVPAWLHRVVRVGLARDPAARYPSLREALRALSRDPARTARRVALAVGGLAVLAGAFGLVAARAATSPCEGAAAALQPAWGAEKAAATRAALAAHKGDVGRVLPMLDDYGRRWVALHTEVCRATRVRGEQSEQLLDARMECLSGRLRRLSALTDLFVAADDEIGEGAVQAVYDLGGLGECQATGALLEPAPVPAGHEHDPDLEEGRHLVAKANALEIVGKFDLSAEAAQGALERARRLGYRSLEADALVMLGTAQIRTGHYPEGKQSYTQALWAAEEARYDEMAFHSAVFLLAVAGYRAPSAEPGFDWGSFARAKLVRLGSPPADEADYRSVLAQYLVKQQRPKDAEVEIRRCLEVLEKLYGQDHPDVGNNQHVLGAVLNMLGRREEALAAYEKSVVLLTRVFGPEHVDVALARGAVGLQLYQLKRCDEAVAKLDEALAMQTRLLGPRQPDLATTHMHLALALACVSRDDDALRHLAEAMAIREEEYGPASSLLVEPLVYRAANLVKLHRWDEALADLRRGQEISGEDGLAKANGIRLLEGWRDYHVARGEWAEALPWAERAVAHCEKNLAADSARLAGARAVLTKVRGPH